MKKLFKALAKPMPAWLSFILIAITILALVRAASIEILYTIRGTALIVYTDDVQITEFLVYNTTHVRVSLAYLGDGDAPDCTVWVIQNNNTATESIPYGWQPETTVYLNFTLQTGNIIVQVITP